MFISIERKYSLFTVEQLYSCDQRLMARMSERVSSTISRVKGTTWNAQRYQITAVGEGRAAKQGSLEVDSINQAYSSTHVRKHTNTYDQKQQPDARSLYETP